MANQRQGGARLNIPAQNDFPVLQTIEDSYLLGLHSMVAMEGLVMLTTDPTSEVMGD